MLDSPKLRARPGKFRVIGVDTFDRQAGHWSYGDFLTFEQAKAVADEKGGTMLKTHVYDDRGQHLHEAGTF